ncbi:hypothetical protein GE061_007005 [Apolygus lucorum]|uniref:Uncharacterized protein n=1 Tax=Apolygus lucorum TaxID=248454 RepID=A0A6A4J1F0_APOLU|nr:hypothetical protein GE061_007005 [Apolygus lucorum]
MSDHSSSSDLESFSNPRNQYDKSIQDRRVRFAEEPSFSKSYRSPIRRRYFNRNRTKTYPRRTMGSIHNFHASKSMFIYNISRYVDIKNLENLFRRAGTVAFFSVHLDRKGRVIGTGEIRYEEKRSVFNALATLQGMVVDGRKLDIRALGSKRDKW